MARAIFLDRDGVINHIVDRGDDCVVAGRKVRYTGPWKHEEFRLKDDVIEVLTELRNLGFLVILITNQPDVKYGVLPEEDHKKIMNDVCLLPFHDVFVCEHTRYDGCECKKPKSGMILAATEKHDIDLAVSYMVGDTENDIMAGKDAGCKTILIEQYYNIGVDADIKVSNLREFISLIRESL